MYNDLVWNRVLDREKMDKKLKISGYRFHHEISTEVTLLYSKSLSSTLVRKEGTAPQNKKTKI